MQYLKKEVFDGLVERMRGILKRRGLTGVESEFIPENLREGSCAFEFKKGTEDLLNDAAEEFLATDGIDGTSFDAEEGSFAICFDYEPKDGELVDGGVSAEEMKDPRIFDVMPSEGSDQVFLVLSGVNFDDILRGSKKEEWRDHSERYAQKLLSRPLKTVLFQHGYSAANGAKPRQMVVEITDISIYDNMTRKSVPSSQYRSLPKGFCPDLFRIGLGRVLSYRENDSRERKRG